MARDPSKGGGAADPIRIELLSVGHTTLPNPEKRMIRLLLAVYSLLLTILLLVSDPAALLGLPSSPGEAPGYGVHFVAFTILGSLAALAFPGSVKRRLALLILYALVIESLQAFVPERSVQVIDYAENLVGLLLGTAVGHWITQKRPAG